MSHHVPRANYRSVSCASKVHEEPPGLHMRGALVDPWIGWNHCLISIRPQSPTTSPTYTRQWWQWTLHGQVYQLQGFCGKDISDRIHTCRHANACIHARGGVMTEEQEEARDAEGEDQISAENIGAALLAIGCHCWVSKFDFIFRMWASAFWLLMCR